MLTTQPGRRPANAPHQPLMLQTFPIVKATKVGRGKKISPLPAERVSFCSFCYTHTPAHAQLQERTKLHIQLRKRELGLKTQMKVKPKVRVLNQRFNSYFQNLLGLKDIKKENVGRSPQCELLNSRGHVQDMFPLMNPGTHQIMLTGLYHNYRKDCPSATANKERLEWHWTSPPSLLRFT